MRFPGWNSSREVDKSGFAGSFVAMHWQSPKLLKRACVLQLACALCPTISKHQKHSPIISNSPGQTPRSSRLATVWIVLEDSFGRQLDDICWVCEYYSMSQYVYVVVCPRSRWECWLGRHGWLACGMPRGLVPLVFLVAGKTGVVWAN